MPRPVIRLVLLLVTGAVVLGAAAIGVSWYETESIEPPVSRPPVVKRKNAIPLDLITEDPDITVSLPSDLGGAHALVKPMPYRHLLDERDGWFSGHIVAATRASAGDKPWGEDAAAWMMDAWKLILDHPSAPEKQGLVERGRALLAAGCTDPAVMALQGLIHPELPVQLDLLHRCLPGLEKGGWSPALRALVHDRLARSKKPTDPTQVTKLVDALVSARNAGDFADDAGAAALLAIEGDVDDELDPYASRVANRLADGRGMPAWATATLLGRLRISLAWRSRGSGWADSVTEDGWRGFRQELALARTALDAAVALAPGRSEPRIAMLTVVLGEGGDAGAERMREQFANVQQASPDHLVACSKLIGALRPRWFGDAETMLAQAVAWAGNADYDGYLPWAGLQAFRDLDRDLDLSGEVYRQPGVPEAFDRVAAGYLAAPHPLIPPRTLHAIAFRAAFLGGHYLLALPHWRALEGKPTENLAADPRLTMRFVEGMCELGARDQTPAVDELIAHRGSNPDPKLIARLISSPHLAPSSREWLDHLRITAENRLRFARGETLALPGPSGLGGWLPLHGTWRAEANALVVDSGYLGHLLPLSVPVGDHFVMSGLIGIASTSNGAWQSGIVFGHPKAQVEDSRGWGSVRFRPAQGGVSAEIGDGFMLPREVRTVAVSDPRNFRFRIEIHDALCTVAIDGRTALDHIPIPRTSVMDADAVVGLGAYMNDNEVRIRYADLRVGRDEPRAESGGMGVPP